LCVRISVIHTGIYHSFSLHVLVCFQLSIYKHVRELFPERPWLDVVSKADLLEEPPAEAPVEEAESYMLAGPAGALRVSVQTKQGLDEVLTQPS
jgi:hypothetical protein